jgi:acyl carrier protein
MPSSRINVKTDGRLNQVQLAELVGSVLNVDVSTIDDNSSPTSLQGWDSLMHISLISAVEETYSVFFSAAEMRETKSVGDLRRLLTAKGVQQA